MKKLLLPLATAILLSTALAQDTTYNLLWKPKPKEELKYKMKVEAKIETVDLVFSTDLLLKILRVEPNGDYTLETSFKNGKISVLGEEEALPDEEPEVQKYKANGELVNEKTEENEDSFAELLGQVTDLAQPGKPVKVGEKWSHKLKANERAKLPAAQMDFELVEVTREKGRPVLKVAYKYRQLEIAKPVTADGFFLIDAEDASLVQVQTYLENVSLEAEMPPSSAKLSMIRE